MNKHNHPFIIRHSLANIPGFRRLRQEGTDFSFAHPAAAGQKINLTLTRQKFQLILLILFIFFSLLAARSFWLQVVKGQDYNLVAQGNRLRLETITAERGIIFDRFNRPLVANIPNYLLYFIPQDLPDSEQELNQLAERISSIIPLKQSDILNQFSNYLNPLERYTLIDNLEHSQAITLAVIEDQLPGVNLSVEPRRNYLEQSGLAHVLGYLGKINRAELTSLDDAYHFNSVLGKDGIELQYEHILKGQDGLREIEVDAIGKTKKILNKIEPQIGQSIVLTIDLDLQKKLTYSLEQAIRQAPGSNGGAAIALDPASGEILALVSLPSYDNNFFSAGIDTSAYHNYLQDPAKPLFNRAISGTYPPGSTFKPIVALAALEQGIINQRKTFLSTGGLAVGQWFFPDWKNGGHGRVNVITALAESVNTFFYYIGGGYGNFIGLGIDNITAFAKKFNLAQQLGIDLPGEAAGFLPSKAWKQEYKNEPWYIGDTYHLAIGQGDILVTPLQVAAYTTAIANGGTLYQPHLLKESKSSHIINQDFLAQENVELVRQGLRAAVTQGSARSLNYLPVPVAGKTGTAQVGDGKESHAWFTGFAPYENPSIVITILVENGGEGSRVAIPVFKQIVEWYFSP